MTAWVSKSRLEPSAIIVTSLETALYSPAVRRN